MAKAPYIIAEIGCNHNGDVALAKKMMSEAKACGCDAVKFQLWKKDELFTDQYLRDLDEGRIKLENVSEWKTKEMGLRNIFDQVEKFHIYKKEHIELFAFAKKLKVDVGSTVVTKDGVDFLIEQKVAFLKVASMDTNYPDFVEYVISKNYPAIISTGMGSQKEIDTIVKLIPKRFYKNITLLHCVSLYPPKDEIVNLTYIQTMKENYPQLRIGYSDHTLGYSITLAAVACGAEVLEKHFTLDKNMPGWDHKVSANPQEMRIICTESKRIAAALGTGKKVLSQDEIAKSLKFRRSIISACAIKKGKTIDAADLIMKRPGNGIAPSELNKVIGKRSKRDIPADQLLQWKELI